MVWPSIGWHQSAPSGNLIHSIALPSTFPLELPLALTTVTSINWRAGHPFTLEGFTTGFSFFSSTSLCHFLLHFASSDYSLQSTDLIRLTIPKVRTVFGHNTFRFAAALEPLAKHTQTYSSHTFKQKLQQIIVDGCTC